MTTNTRKRFASSGIILFSLLGSVVSVSAQTSGLARDQQALPSVFNSTSHVSWTAEMADAPSPAEMTLRNLDRTVDIAFPTRPNYFYLNQPVFVGALEEIMDYEQRITDAIDQGLLLSETGEIIDISSSEAVDILGRIIEQSDLPLNLGEASGLLVHSVGDAMGSASGLLHNTPNNPYPLTSALSHATGGLADAATALLQDNNHLQSLSGLPANNSSATSSANNSLLAPVTGLVSGLLGGPPR